MHIPHISRDDGLRRPPHQPAANVVESSTQSALHPLLIRASSLVPSYIRMTSRLVLAAVGFGVAVILAVTGLLALVIFQCRARKRRARRRHHHLSAESFACPGEEGVTARPCPWVSQPHTATSMALLQHGPQGNPVSPTFATPPPAYTDSVPSTLTTAMSLTLPRAVANEAGIRPRALSVPQGGAPQLPIAAPSASLLDLLIAAGLRNSVQYVEEHAHISTTDDGNRQSRYRKCVTHGTAELEVVSSYASDDEDQCDVLPHIDFSHPVLTPTARESSRFSRQSSEIAYLQDDTSLSGRNSRAWSTRFSRPIPARSDTADSAAESDFLTRLTPEPMTPSTSQLGGLRSGWSYPSASQDDPSSLQRRYHAYLQDSASFKLEPPPRPPRERSTTLPPQGTILHHIVNPKYNPAVARSAKGHRRSQSSGGSPQFGSGFAETPLAMGLGVVGLGLTLGATLHNGTGLKRLSLVPEEETDTSEGGPPRETVYVPTATRTRFGMHRRSQTMPAPQPLPSLIPSNPRMPHHRRTPSVTSADTVTSSSKRSSSPLFFSPLLSSPSTAGPETPEFGFSPSPPKVRERSATVCSGDNDLTIKIYYSPKGHVDPSRNSFFDSDTETIKFRLPRTAVFGELCIKAWEKLGVAVKLLMYEDAEVEGQRDMEGDACAKRKEVGAEEWRDVCERAQSRVYFWANDAEVGVVSPGPL